MTKAILVAGLAYGDEGKGACVDFLCRRLPVDLVVRYNGGSQCAHNVVTPEGGHHTFSQFGSGMIANDHVVRTHLSRFMLVDPLSMMNEAEALQTKTGGGVYPWNRTTVDPRCIVITPFHKRLNRLREQALGAARHGSCGMGVGAARELQLQYGDEVLTAGDLTETDAFTFHMLLNTAGYMRKELEELTGKTIDWSDLRNECKALVRQYQYWPVTLSKTLPESQLMVFEGAQGVLLDEKHGQEPHRTWTDCTFSNAYTLLAEAGIGSEAAYRIGCVRSYLTRHGVGTLMNELPKLPTPEPHNATNEWQGSFRAARFDFELIKKSLEHLNGVDSIALSHLDVLGGYYQQSFVGDVARELAPVSVVGYGPTANDREFNALDKKLSAMMETEVRL